MESLFWFAVFGSLFSYFIYPFTLILLKKFYPSPLSTKISASETLQSVTFIITAHNEAKQIKDKLDNTLELDRRGLEVQIIVASDFSTDGTDEIVESYADQGVELVRADQHLGKEYAQLCGIRAAKGNIIVFSDSATRLQASALKTLLPYFNNPAVGALSSEDRFLSTNGEVAGEGYYVKYEMWLRELESNCAGLVGLSGSFFAARKEVCEDWDIHSPSDFNTALNACKAQKLSISCTDVEGFYPNIKDETKEYQRKLRTAIRGMTGLSRHTEVLNPSKFGWYAYQVWSHKVMRWLVPWFMITALLSNFTLLSEPFYIFTLLVQLSGAGIFMLASLRPALRSNSLIKLVYFFYQVNLALAHAAIKFFSGTRMTTWKPSAR
jgi:glycosyltransferase involved in cell wall biosynthesis